MIVAMTEQLKLGGINAQVEPVYLSAGANRHSAVADWGDDGLVAYGSDINIALWRPTDSRPRGVTSLLSGHKETVKAVKFIPRRHGHSSPSSTSYLVSGSDDQRLNLWELSPDGQAGSLVQTLHEHTAAIHCLAVVSDDSRDGGGRTLLASGAADATVRIWIFDESTRLSLVQTIRTRPKYFPLAVALSTLGDDRDGEGYILASAGTKDVIQIFVAHAAAAEAPPEFQLQATLSGHEGWIRSLDFAREQGHGGDLLLASASQDKYIRLWRVHGGKMPASNGASKEPGSNGILPASSGALLAGSSPSNKAHVLNVAGADYSVSFEALLLGHDDWIYSARWHIGAIYDGDSSVYKPQLLSTSADNSLAIWEADPGTGIWITSARLGELSKEKGATTATGSIGGFWTGLWSPSGRTVVCLGRTGSWRRWDLEHDVWNPALSVSGHTKPVTGLAWARDGTFLLSTSLDQTTRLHAEWSTNRHPRALEDGSQGQADDGAIVDPTWHEMSRPQIHGYDLNCVATLGNTRFVSGADEKLMRVFDAPRAVASLLARVTGDRALLDGAKLDAANIPVLGLSNKAVDAVDDATADAAEAVATTAATEEEAAGGGGGGDVGRDGGDDEGVVTGPVFRRSTLNFARPPYEDSLSRHTLWPEAEKLYGHGYELSCLATSHDGALVASACRASSANHAVVRLFETARWTELRPPLVAHSLTATRLCFSPDDAFLLSVGRDRQWAVFEKKKKVGGSGYELLQTNPKGHARMILDAAWVPARRPAFATAGRDKNVKIWAMRETLPTSDVAVAAMDAAAASERRRFELVATIPEEHPATAIDFLWRHAASQPPVGEGEGPPAVLAVGTEAGRISLYALGTLNLKVASKRVLEPHFCLPKSVLQLSWRPVRANEQVEGGGGEQEEGERAAVADLAVAGEDSSLRIYRFRGL